MNQSDRMDYTGAVNYGTYICRGVVVLFVAGHTVSLIRLFEMNRLAFFHRGWNYFEVGTVCTYWLTIALWIWEEVNRGHYSGDESSPTRRIDLPMFDPILLGECTMAVASTMSTLRLTRWLILHPWAGPLQCGINTTGFYDIYLYNNLLPAWIDTYVWSDSDV